MLCDRNQILAFYHPVLKGIYRRYRDVLHNAGKHKKKGTRLHNVSHCSWNTAEFLKKFS